MQSFDVTINILAKEVGWFRRGVLEAICIRKEKPTLNQDGGDATK
jgi:hypothetical protein